MSDGAQQEIQPGSRYRFLSRIATGGMAELYLGEATGAGGVSKRVALKRILPGHANDNEYLEMFLEEARLASTLQHPNIVQTYDVIRSGDDYVMVMEFLEGSDLYQFRRRLRTSGQPLLLPHVLYLATNVLNGLHYAHERRRPDGKLLGIVHRDVSPQNVFLTYDGGVKLLDFGIAKAETGVHKTESGVLKGKVLYMSPEQCAGRSVDRRADLYALGVVVYQLLTGSLPHRGKNAYDTMKSIIDEPVPKPTSLNSRLSPELERIVMKALAKDPDQRYPSAREMQIELESYVAEHGLFVSSIGFSTFVETTLGPRRPPSESATLVNSPKSMPRDIELASGEASQIQRLDRPATGGMERSLVAPGGGTEQVLFESPHATLRRMAGVQVLFLSGTIDERFDAAKLAGMLKGEVVVDSADVARITSFGIRQIIALFTEAKPRVTGLYHVRCSVAWVNQVTMIRSLLGGGRVLSFTAPYVDAGSGTSFTVLLAGQDAARAIERRELPAAPSPSNPSMAGEFDDDPDLYFNFAEDFLSEPPPHLGPVLRLLDERDKRLELELSVDDGGTTLYIRRAMRENRWARVVQSLEGAVKVDLSEVPTSDDVGVRGFVKALEAVADELKSLRLVGAPLPVAAAVLGSAALRPLVSFETVQVYGRCRSCGSERRILLPPAEAVAAGATPVPRACTRCGGAVQISSEVASLPWATRQRTQP
ncbi:MAG: serine/threonine-protein kinase, partial [Myxococcota bacterium]